MLRAVLCDVPPTLVGDPTLLLAVSSAMWSSGGRGERETEAPCPDSHKLRPPSESCSSVTWPASTGRHLSWACRPFSTPQIRGSTGLAVCLAALVPPSGFGYPLDGLLPANPSKRSQTPAALMGFSPSKHVIPDEVHRRCRRSEPTCRFPGA